MSIMTETLADGRIRHYSDENVMIRQIETGNLYEDAVDMPNVQYSYEETDIPIDGGETAEELLDIIVGGENV